VSNIFKCGRCRDTFIEEEYDKHACTPTLKDVQKIEFDYYYVMKNGIGKETIVIKGMDGILYEFVRCERLVSDKIPFLPVRRNFTKTKI